jgi:hypothetical protein
MAPKKQELIWELTEHNEFFDMIVDMIPNKRVVSGRHQQQSDTAPAREGSTTGSQQNKKSKFHKDPGPESKEGRRAAAKATKRRKLDDRRGTLPDEKEHRGVATEASKPTDGRDGGSATAVSSTVTSREASPEKSRIEALRAKLHAKLASLKGSDRPSAEQVSKRAARRAEKQRRQQEQKSGGTKTAAGDSLPATYKLPPSSPVPRDAANEDLAATLGFGRLIGIRPPKSSQNYLETNKALANLNKTRNLHKLLADAEAKKAKLEALQQSSDAKDRKEATKLLWADAIQEASGNRVKDDPAKIKKALKQKAAKKQKSQKAWKSRMEQVQKAQDDRQRQRTQNLQARKLKGRRAAASAVSASSASAGKDDGSARVGSSALGPGRRLSRPGFEGRKQEFLNSGKE